MLEIIDNMVPLRKDTIIKNGYVIVGCDDWLLYEAINIKIVLIVLALMILKNAIPKSCDVLIAHYYTLNKVVISLQVMQFGTNSTEFFKSVNFITGKSEVKWSHSVLSVVIN